MKFAPPAMGSSRDVYTGPCAFISLIVNVPFDASTDSTTATCPAAGSAPCTPGGKLTIAPGTRGRPRHPVTLRGRGRGPHAAIAPILAHMLPPQTVGAQARAPRALALRIRDARIARTGQTAEPGGLRLLRAHPVPTGIRRAARHRLRALRGRRTVHARVPRVQRGRHADLVAGLVAGVLPSTPCLSSQCAPTNSPSPM